MCFLSNLARHVKGRAREVGRFIVDLSPHTIVLSMHSNLLRVEILGAEQKTT